jgi:hypothetical protein
VSYHGHRAPWGRQPTASSTGTLARCAGCRCLAALAEPPAALLEARNFARRIEDLLEAAGDPAAREFASGGVDHALRRVQIEVEDLLDQGR